MVLSTFILNSFHKSKPNKYLIALRSFSVTPTKYRQNYEKSSYLHYCGKEPLVYRNIGQSLNLSVQKYGDREAIVSCHEDKRYTFTEVRDYVDKLAAGFLKIGLNYGDRIGLWAPNYIHWYMGMLAAARVGLISVGLNPAFQAPEIEYCINKVGCKAIVATESFKTQNYYEILRRISPDLANFEPGKINASKIPSLQSIIIDTKQKLPGAFQLDEILSLPDNEDVKKINSIAENIDPDSPCNIQFTSGTTGNPKAAVLSHCNFVNNSIHTGNRNELNVKHQKICVQVPLFHAFGVAVTLVSALTHGATLVLPSAGFDPEASLKAIRKEKCTILHGTPTMYIDLIKKKKELGLSIDSAEIAVTGGSICSPQLFKDIKNCLNLKKVKSIFGLTETTAVIFQTLVEENNDLAHTTVGHIHDHVEAKIIDSSGKTVPFGQPGELCVRGYMNMLGYFGDEEKTKEIIGPDRWLKTGDVFIIEENGYGNIVGRIKDMIIRGGENIFPKEIENFLETHPDIIQVQAIGVPDERMGEEICAFIRLHDNKKNLTQEQIKEFCKGNIAHFKIPKYVIKIDDFPKTTSGKIQKFKLLDIYEKLK